MPLHAMDLLRCPNRVIIVVGAVSQVQTQGLNFDICSLAAIADLFHHATHETVDNDMVRC